MTENKRTVDKYMDGFRKSDHARILSCLMDDIEWEIPGAFHLIGKDAFDEEIENEGRRGLDGPQLMRVSLGGRTGPH
jgi:ketosteroid isomerase-like protein